MVIFIKKNSIYKHERTLEPAVLTEFHPLLLLIELI